MPKSTLRLETVGDLASALGDLCHDLLMQPDIHFRRTVERAFVAELLGELLARAQTAVELEELHEIDDRLFPIVRFLLRVGEFLDHGFDFGARHRLGCPARRGGARRSRGRARCRGRACGTRPKYRRYDISKNAHDHPPYGSMPSIETEGLHASSSTRLSIPAFAWAYKRENPGTSRQSVRTCKRKNGFICRIALPKFPLCG